MPSSFNRLLSELRITKSSISDSSNGRWKKLTVGRSVAHDNSLPALVIDTIILRVGILLALTVGLVMFGRPQIGKALFVIIAILVIMAAVIAIGNFVSGNDTETEAETNSL